MSEQFDAIVVGMGPGGETVAQTLMDAGRRVAVVEKELIGGECPYWACMPSKTLLRPVEARAETSRVAGVSTPALDWTMIRDYRDVIVGHLDDSSRVAAYRNDGATVVKGEGKLAGPGELSVNGDRLQARDIILSTGSRQAWPRIDGLEEVPVWTNREATNLTDIPARVLLIGGSAVGIELATFLSRMGSSVTMLERGPRLLMREVPELGERALSALGGVDVRLDCRAQVVRRDGTDTVAELDDGTSVRVDVIVLASGRIPNSDLDLKTVDVSTGPHGEVPTDDHCRVTDGLWAVGDLTGVAMFTHTAMYQGRVVADNLLGRPHTANYLGIPRVVFSEPEIAAVGLTADAARRQGFDVATSQVELPEVIHRPETYETKPRGTLGLVADRRRRTLVGVWAIAPQVGEWIHTGALAIRAQLPVDILVDGIAQFPTFNEAYYAAASALRL
ncbi:dihydrolipoyl dehydrogenase family protein [Actinopolymorpha singaporensis]|uniref:Dihydrolipoamide dehydrogenase n=1 Tax=Actinopolymorpha singaporensis TaxID=117157 RepID=A0A1H1TZ08_9ACTN|nr:NAD(P)/FAD-dependent oxidoreductase [Actinopolymorpha singaporensis]SDS65505.1 dihydrolipoamide dehydrogenase [Actinopolymorpha singaporensis]